MQIGQRTTSRLNVLKPLSRKFNTIDILSLPSPHAGCEQDGQIAQVAGDAEHDDQRHQVADEQPLGAVQRQQHLPLAQALGRVLGRGRSAGRHSDLAGESAVKPLCSNPA